MVRSTGRRLLYHCLIALVVFIQTTSPVAAAAVTWLTEPAMSHTTELDATTADAGWFRARGETREAFFTRVGQRNPERLQLAALRALEYYLNHPAPADAPDDAFEQSVEKYLALPVAMLSQAGAQLPGLSSSGSVEPAVQTAAVQTAADATALFAPAPSVPTPVAVQAATPTTAAAAEESIASPTATPLAALAAAEPTAAAPPIEAVHPTPVPTRPANPAPTAIPIAIPIATPARAPVITARVSAVSVTDQETRTVGVIRITADSFTDLGNGQTRAAGNVVIGDYLPFLGAGDVITYDGNSLTATITLALRVGGEQIELFTGPITAPVGTGVATLGSGVNYALSKIAGFPISAGLVISQVNLAAEVVTGTATLHLNPPGVDTTAVASFTITGASGGISYAGNLQAFSFSAAGVTLDVPHGASISGSGVQAPSVILTLPSTFGGLTTTVSDLRVTTDSLKMGGVQATFALPDLRIGGAATTPVSFTQNQAALAFDEGAQAYRLTITSTLALSLPSNPISITASVTLGSAGGQPVLSGMLANLTLNVAGASLAMSGLTINNTGLSVAQATLTLPAKLGGASGSISQISITQDGLGFASATISLPDIKFGDGSKLKITAIQARLAQHNNQYVFSASATLQINLPGNARSFGLTITVDGSGNVSGTLSGTAVVAGGKGNVNRPQSGITLNLAGVSLNLTSPTISNSGITVPAATLTLPASLGSSSVTVSGVTITQDGLSFNSATLTFPDIKIGDGSKLKIAGIQATMATAVDGYTFSVSGTLQVRLPGNSTDISITGSINTAGHLSAAVSELKLTIASITLDMRGLSMDDNGLSVTSATLALPGKLGNATGSVSNVTITQDGLMIGGATAQINFPNFKIGSTNGFAVTGVKATIEITNNGSAYRVTLAGTVAITIPGASASASGSLSVDNLGAISGSVQSFSLALAGLTLSAQNIQIASDGSFSVSSARLDLPAGFGGGYVQLNNVVIRPGGGSNAVSIGSGSFQLPKISVGGFTLQVSGSLQQVAGGYQIQAAGLFNMPSLGSGGGCSGIQVSVTLYVTASGQTVLEIEPAKPAVSDRMGTYSFTSPAALKLKNASLTLNCSLPIGTTGFYVTSLSGMVELDENSTTVSVAVEISAGQKVAGVAVASAQAQATVTADPFSLALSGTIKVFTFSVGGASASIKPSQFYAKLWINAIVLQGQAEVTAWSDTRGFHLTGQATMTVGIPKGSIVNKCSSWLCCPNGSAYKGYNCWPWKVHTCQTCICIPPSSWNVGSVSIQAGEFSTPSSGYAWGFKGEVTILGYDAAFYVDTNGTLKVGGDVNNYHLVTQAQLRAAQARRAVARATGIAAAGADWTDLETGVLFTADGEILVPVNMDNPRHASFEMSRFGGVPGLELIDPDGVRITPSNLPTGVSYTQVTTYTVADEPDLALAGVATADLAPIVAPSTATTVRAAGAQDLVLANRFASRAGIDPSVRSAMGGVVSAEATTPTARLRFVHALAEVPTVDVRLDGAVLFPNIAYGAATPYISATAGSHVISIVPAGAVSPELASVTASLGEETDNTAVAIGRAASPALLALTDDNSRPDPGKARLRVVHASADTPAVDLALDADSPTLFGIGYASASETVPADAGVHDLHVRSAGTTTDLLVVSGATLADGRVYTVFLMGVRQGGDGSYPLRAVLSQDAAPAGRLRFINGVQAEASLNVLVDGQPLFTEVPFVSNPAPAKKGPYTPYAALAPGNHVIAVTSPATPSVPLGILLVTVVPDQDVTVVGVPLFVNGRSVADPLPVRLWVAVDDNSLPSLGQTRLRLIHARGEPQAIDLAISSGVTLTQGLSRNTASAYVVLPGGTYTLEVRETATSLVLATLPAEVLQEGLVHSVVVRDGATAIAEATADQVTQRTTQATYEVDDPATGTWQIALTGDIGADDQYLLNVTGAVSQATLTGVTATPAATNTARVGWQLASSRITTTVGIYANPGLIETTLEVTGTDGTTDTVTSSLFAGHPLVEKLIGDPQGWTNGSPQSQMVTLNRLPSGTYHIWVQADDGRTRLAQVYAGTVITVTHAWIANWVARLAAVPSYRTLTLTWDGHPNPDVDRYRLKLGTQTGIAEQSVDVGDALSYHFTGLNPDQQYVIWMEGVDSETGQVSSSEEILAAPLAASFTLTGPAGDVSIISGQAREVTLTLSTAEAAYPDAVVLSAGCQPLTATVAATSECAGVPNGIAVAVPNEPLTPTLAGIEARVVISTASTLPDGTYTVSIIARGGGMEHPVDLIVQTQRPYFQLSGAPAGAILEAQGTSVIQISATGLHGTTDSITLALEDAPVGLQWTFGRTVIQPGEQTTLTLVDTELLGSGNYTLRVIGNDGRESDELALVLVVREPQYGITGQPSKARGLVGKAGVAVYDLTLTSHDGWTAPVTLSVADATPPPRGALSLSLNSTSDTGAPTLIVTPPGHAYVIAKWVADTPPGLYLFTVQAAGGGQSMSVNLALEIAPLLKLYMPQVAK